MFSPDADAEAVEIEIMSLRPLRSTSSITTRALKYPLENPLYAQRHLAECRFSKLKKIRHVSTQYEKTAENYLAVVVTAAITLWMRSVSAEPSTRCVRARLPVIAAFCWDMPELCRINAVCSAKGAGKATAAFVS